MRCRSASHATSSVTWSAPGFSSIRVTRTKSPGTRPALAASTPGAYGWEPRSTASPALRVTITSRCPAQLRRHAPACVHQAAKQAQCPEATAQHNLVSRGEHGAGCAARRAVASAPVHPSGPHYAMHALPGIRERSWVAAAERQISNGPSWNPRGAPALLRSTCLGPSPRSMMTLSSCGCANGGPQDISL